MTSAAAMPRRLGLGDAVAIGLGSMIGAGVFAVFAPAAAAAGTGLLVGLGIAAVVAFGNATSSAQLAAQYPTSGGTYIYGREQLGPWAGYVAGWCFVIGKTASCAAMALTFAAYVAPPGWDKPLAVLAVLMLAGVNAVGVTRTALLTKVIVVFVLCVLGLVLITGIIGDSGASVPVQSLAADFGGQGWYGVLQSAGLLFFAFAGYARIATMGEEVRTPQRTIPRAIMLSLGLVLLVYAAVAVVALNTLGPQRLAQSRTPLVDIAATAGLAWTAPLIQAGAAAATLGALLALIAGVGRTSLAMARHDDLPRWLATVHPRFQVPQHAEFTIAAIVCVLVLLTDLRAAIGFSSFGVLLYYLITNLAAYRQPPTHRRYPRPLQVIGALGCLVLVATLPWQSILGGLTVLAVGVLYRLARLRHQT